MLPDSETIAVKRRVLRVLSARLTAEVIGRPVQLMLTSKTWASGSYSFYSLYLSTGPSIEVETKMVMTLVYAALPEETSTKEDLRGENLSIAQ